MSHELNCPIQPRPVIDNVREMADAMERVNVRPGVIHMTPLSYALLRKQDPEMLGYDEQGREYLCIGNHNLLIDTTNKLQGTFLMEGEDQG